MSRTVSGQKGCPRVVRWPYTFSHSAIVRSVGWPVGYISNMHSTHRAFSASSRAIPSCLVPCLDMPALERR